MSKQDLLKTQTCVLRVNIDCEGCKNKVKRTLQKIDGVYAVAIDMQQGKVTVTGNVEPGVLIKKLEKSGKRAELCSSEKGKSSDKSKKSGFDDNVNDQLKKLLQLGNIGKGGGVDDVKKPQQKGGKEQQKSGAINVSGGGKNLQQMKFQELLEQMKSGSKDFNMKGLQKPAAVKVESLPGKGVGHDFGDFSSGDDLDEDDDYSDDDDEFDEDDDEFDEDEDEFDDDDEEEEEELDYGSDQNHKQQKTFMPITSNDLGKEKKSGGGGEKAKKGGGGGGGDDKKSGGIMSMIGRAIGGNNEGKDGNLGKKGGGEGGGKSQGGGKKGGESKSTGGGGGPKNGGEGKIGKKGGGGGGGKDGGFQGVVVPNHTKGGGGMGQMVQYPAGPMGPQFPATPIMNMNGGGYYQGSMGPVPGNPYQQQQYMAMMMNQQRMMNGGGGGAGMYHPAMFGRPPPGYGYVPPMPPPAYNDHIAHMFSDENPGSCSIM